MKQVFLAAILCAVLCLLLTGCNIKLLGAVPDSGSDTTEVSTAVTAGDTEGDF